MYLNIGLIEVWNFDECKGIDILPVEVGSAINSSSVFKLEWLHFDEKWHFVSFDLTYYKGFVTLIEVAVDKAINYFIWKTLQF